MLQNPHNVWVCAHVKINVSVTVLDKQHLRTINKCSNSRYSLLPLRQTTCSFLLHLSRFLFFSLVPSQSLHLPFPLSFPLSLSFPPPTHLLALLQCALIGWKLVSNHFNFVRVGYTIGYLEQAWVRERREGGGHFPSVPYPLQGGRSGHDFASEAQADLWPASIGLDGAGSACLAWRPLEIKVYLIIPRQRWALRGCQETDESCFHFLA